MNSNKDDSRPWIPWELIKPYDDEAGQPLIDHDFLCMQFDLARWVCPAPTSAAAEIAVDTLACIVLSDSGLAEAQRERDDLTALCGRHDGTSGTPHCTTPLGWRTPCTHIPTRASVLTAAEGHALSAWLDFV